MALSCTVALLIGGLYVLYQERSAQFQQTQANLTQNRELNKTLTALIEVASELVSGSARAKQQWHRSFEQVSRMVNKLAETAETQSSILNENIENIQGNLANLLILANRIEKLNRESANIPAYIRSILFDRLVSETKFISEQLDTFTQGELTKKIQRYEETRV